MNFALRWRIHHTGAQCNAPRDGGGDDGKQECGDANEEQLQHIYVSILSNGDNIRIHTS
jgi:hypothetical protein